MAAAAAKSVRFGQHLKELRIHICQRSESSRGVREFIENHYVPIKQANPRFPLLIRECSGVQPKVYARYEYGVEKSSPLAGLSNADVLQTVYKMAAQQP